jgi:hypothetical protein
MLGMQPQQGRPCTPRLGCHEAQPQHAEMPP